MSRWLQNQTITLLIFFPKVLYFKNSLLKDATVLYVKHLQNKPKQLQKTRRDEGERQA